MADTPQAAPTAAEVIAAQQRALEPFNIPVPDAKENETFEVTCGGWHLKGVRAALALAARWQDTPAEPTLAQKIVAGAESLQEHARNLSQVLAKSAPTAAERAAEIVNSRPYIEAADGSRIVGFSPAGLKDLITRAILAAEQAARQAAETENARLSTTLDEETARADWHADKLKAAEAEAHELRAGNGILTGAVEALKNQYQQSRERAEAAEQERDALRAELAAAKVDLATALDACIAAAAYDRSIAGRAIRGECDLRQEIGSAQGDDLDALYADWADKVLAVMSTKAAQEYIAARAGG